ncbi:MAG: hypothetical protein ACFB9N_05250 [Geitlerinemataceae cyanobacterium]
MTPDILQRTTTLLKQLSPAEQQNVLQYIEALLQHYPTQPTNRHEKFLASLKTHPYTLPADYNFDRDACYER